MSSNSSIEWTEQTWNPVTGCTKVSPGCKHCYAETMAIRLKAMGAAGYEDGFKLSLHPKRLDQPLRRKKPTVYFVNSMSDLFHEKVPLDFIKSVFEVMNECSQHTFQVLTKRPHIAARYSKYIHWSDKTTKFPWWSDTLLDYNLLLGALTFLPLHVYQNTT